MKKSKNDSRLSWWVHYLRSFFGGLLLKKEFRQVEKYILFVGYPRSGHSLIGSLLDAHPLMMISNELNALQFFLKKVYFRHQIFYFIWKNSKKHGLEGRSNTGYNYSVPEQWQGKCQKLLAIGDKKGGLSSMMLDEKDDFLLLKEVEKISKAKLKIIHVIRNPYDNISTMVLRQAKRTGKLTDELLEEKMSKYLENVATNEKIKQQNPAIIFDVHLDDFITQPVEGLRRIFEFLEMEVTEKYLNDCGSIVWKKTNQSRFKMSLWTPEKIQELAGVIQQYDFLKRYKY